MYKARLKLIVSSIAVVFFICIVIFPFYWLLVSSLKSPGEIFSSSQTIFPIEITLENYISVFKGTALLRYFLNSTIISVSTVTLVIFIGSMAAYAISRYYFRGKIAFFLIILISQMLPITTLIIPLYMFWGKLHMLNSYASIILTYSGFLIPIAIWLLTSYFNRIPKEVDESALIDGCSPFMVLFRIILPQAMPGIIAASLCIFISVWQELMIAMTFISDDSMRTLPAGILTFITSQGIKWGPVTAAGFLTCIPVIILFVFLQKTLISGLTEGAIKG